MTIEILVTGQASRLRKRSPKVQFNPPLWKYGDHRSTEVGDEPQVFVSVLWSRGLVFRRGQLRASMTEAMEGLAASLSRKKHSA